MFMNAIGHPPSAIRHRPSTIGDQPSAIGKTITPSFLAC
jgi:hypothetical protein